MSKRFQNSHSYEEGREVQPIDECVREGDVKHREEKQGPQGRRNKLNSGEKIEEMSPVNKILRESIFWCLLAVNSV
jgi:hypothetical protein